MESVSFCRFDFQIGDFDIEKSLFFQKFLLAFFCIMLLDFFFLRNSPFSSAGFISFLFIIFPRLIFSFLLYEFFFSLPLFSSQFNLAFFHLSYLDLPGSKNLRSCFKTALFWLLESRIYICAVYHALVAH